jgi:hypothetical protein
MAWNWSYTTEYKIELYEILNRQSVEFLAESLAEWDSYFNNNSEKTFKESYNKYLKLPVDILADSLWESMSNEKHGKNCNNGGCAVWCCPTGCHVIS